MSCGPEVSAAATLDPDARRACAACGFKTSWERIRLIQESAYYRAEARGFSPGYEEQDWLEAEAEMKARLGVKQPGTD